MAKILVTGGTGFIGSNLVKALVDENHEITVIGTRGECQVPKMCRFFQIPLDKFDLEVVGTQDVCFHQAANNDTTDLDEAGMMQANFSGPMNLFCRLSEGGCKRFIYASSTAVYGRSQPPYVESVTPIAPLNPYAHSKAKFDEFALDFAEETGATMVGLRYCNVYGPNEAHKGKRASMIFQFLQQLKAGQRPKLFKFGEQRRDWCYIQDVVAANLTAMNYKGVNIFNVGSGSASSFNEIIRLLNKELGTNLEPEYIENPYEAAYQTYTQCDVSKARERLGWQPAFSVEQGISELVRLAA